MDIKEAMKATCWKSLSYCCSLKKECDIRDKALENLHMTGTEYAELKRQFDESIQKTRMDKWHKYQKKK